MQCRRPPAHAFHISQPCDFVPCEHLPHRRERDRFLEFGAVFLSNPAMDLATVAALSPLSAGVFESPWPQELGEEDHEAVLEAVEFPDFCCQVQTALPDIGLVTSK